MKSIRFLFVTTAVSALIVPVLATADVPPRAPSDDTVSTGVARARDPLDSATSTSVLHEEDVERLGARGVGDLLRDVPGLRSDAAGGEGNGTLTVRGLPAASSGAKFIQVQEDGLPVLEFGDIFGAAALDLVRTDLTLSQVEVIRGGSASTFASNSPGGVINFIAKTGEVQGGAVALSSGLDYRSSRADVTYGGPIGGGWRFQAGGFFRQGEGPRRTGYDAQTGGQVRFNVTRELDGGYVRLYGKYLNDRTPFYDVVPFFYGGSEDHPTLTRIKGFDALHDALASRYLRDFLLLGRRNDVISADLRDGQHLRERAVGVEAQFDLGGWLVQERLRYSGVDGVVTVPFTSAYSEINDGVNEITEGLDGSLGGKAVYASGPRTGQPLVSSAAHPLNGNGLSAAVVMLDLPIHSYDDVTNEVRVSRLYDVGAGELTVTGGLYTARQTIDNDALWVTMLTDLRGNGNAALTDVVTQDGKSLTDHGVFFYRNAFAPLSRRSVQTDNAIDAPFASLNYHVGKVSIGGSVRYDRGSAIGRTWGADRERRWTQIPLDINHDGVVSLPESAVQTTAFQTPAPVDYHYHYLSYSSGVTYRVVEPLAVFARYSRGARTPATRLLFHGELSANGHLRNQSAAVNSVRQAEAGAKYRSETLALNLTGFWASTFDDNYDAIRSRPIQRDYSARGIEFEGSLRLGVLGLRGGATYTDATIDKDRLDPRLSGHVPRAQPRLRFQASPEIDLSRVAFGATFIGATRSFAQEENKLVIPAAVTTNAFVELRPADRLRLIVNASNLFDTVALAGLDAPSSPSADSQGVEGTPLVGARPLTGRTISATLRLDF
ncbi:TonB-dependent receptor domain-containing protein [Sphingomonas sp. BK580]|uniref:TonB-dependent receptor n=1 Tax=Sphingomonas sp. BK580 TaxID=2586972 RepID=UPI001619778B|nr:TonB-dependent receptor [Sphingomonas sp. BK580]MBB3692321.1 outer membrane receptor protein involved in Fe transport [Sphingomonas sp. BK580]